MGWGVEVDAGESEDAIAAAVVEEVAVMLELMVETVVGIRGRSMGATESAPNCASRNMRRRASFSGAGREVLAWGLCWC